MAKKTDADRPERWEYEPEVERWNQHYLLDDLRHAGLITYVAVRDQDGGMSRRWCPTSAAMALIREAESEVITAVMPVEPF